MLGTPVCRLMTVTFVEVGEQSSPVSVVVAPMNCKYSLKRNDQIHECPHIVSNIHMCSALSVFGLARIVSINCCWFLKSILLICQYINVVYSNWCCNHYAVNNDSSFTKSTYR